MGIENTSPLQKIRVDYFWCGYLYFGFDLSVLSEPG